MDYKEPEVMKMLHEIREKQHNETKSLSNDEWLKNIRSKAESFKKKFGLKLPTREIVKK